MPDDTSRPPNLNSGISPKFFVSKSGTRKNANLRRNPWLIASLWVGVCFCILNSALAHHCQHSTLNTVCCCCCTNRNRNRNNLLPWDATRQYRRIPTRIRTCGLFHMNRRRDQRKSKKEPVSPYNALYPYILPLQSPHFG